MKRAMICQACEEGNMHYDVRDVEITRKGLKAVVPNVAGLFCDHCNEIDFDNKTDSAVRYAATGDELVLKARKAAAEGLKRARLKLHLSQTEASRISGGGHNAFSRYETGATQPLAAVVNLFALLEKRPELLKELQDASHHEA